MTEEEVIGLLAMINSYDTRIDPTATQVAAWQAALEPSMPLGFASQQVIRYYANDNKYLLTVGFLNARWRDERREHTFFKALPEPQGTRLEKDRARWWMMHGITEGIEELNTGVARDGHYAHILHARMKNATNLRTLDHKKEFPRLDWDWYEKHRSTFGKRLGF